MRVCEEGLRFLIAAGPLKTSNSSGNLHAKLRCSFFSTKYRKFEPHEKLLKMSDNLVKLAKDKDRAHIIEYWDSADTVLLKALKLLFWDRELQEILT